MKSKIKNYFDKTVFWTILYNEKIEISGVFLDKGSGSGIYSDPGDPKRKDPTGFRSGSATLIITLYLVLISRLQLNYIPVVYWSTR